MGTSVGALSQSLDSNEHEGCPPQETERRTLGRVNNIPLQAGLRWEGFARVASRQEPVVLFRPPPSEALPDLDDRSEITDIMTVVDDREVSHLPEPNVAVKGLALYSIKEMSPRTDSGVEKADIVDKYRLFCTQPAQSAWPPMRSAPDNSKEQLVWF